MGHWLTASAKLPQHIHSNADQTTEKQVNYGRVTCFDSEKLRRQLYFSRPELSQILAAYSARVAAGEWRDYAIDHLAGSATFSIFRHTHENPLFVIEKKQRHPKEAPQFILRDRNRVLCRSGTVGDIIGHFNKLPRLVTG